MGDIAIPIITRFWIYLISDIASILCSIFVLYYLLFDRQLRRSLHNHVVIAVLIINLISQLTTVPWLLSYAFNGVVLIFTPFFCQTWRFIDSFTYVTTARLVAWASVERHILVFHDRWISTKRKKALLHYLPIGLIIAYGSILCIVIHYFLSCNRPYYSVIPFCGFYSCAYDSAAYSMFEFLTSGVTNAFLIATFSAGLVVRIVRQKYRLQQEVNWRRQRKMTIQLMSITLLFYILYLPNVIAGILLNSGVPYSLLETFMGYGQFFSYFINFLLPFVCAGTLPQLEMKITHAFKFWRWHKGSTRVEPFQHTIMNRTNDQQTIHTRMIRRATYIVQTIMSPIE